MECVLGDGLGSGIIGMGYGRWNGAPQGGIEPKVSLSRNVVI